MDFIKKIFNPKSIPFPKRLGNEKYSELLKFTGIPEGRKYKTGRIIQEIHLDNETVVSKLDWNLEYLHIDKNGRTREFDLVKSKFEKSSKKLFERCDESLTEIMRLGIPRSEFFNENGVRLTFLTDQGDYSISGKLRELEKRKIIGHTIVHFFNMIELTNPGGLKKLIK